MAIATGVNLDRSRSGRNGSIGIKGCGDIPINDQNAIVL